MTNFQQFSIKQGRMTGMSRDLFYTDLHDFNVMHICLTVRLNNE